jgi:hypothetical protein
MSFVRKHLGTVAVAGLTAFAVAAGPAMATTVVDVARNALHLGGKPPSAYLLKSQAKGFLKAGVITISQSGPFGLIETYSNATIEEYGNVTRINATAGGVVIPTLHLTGPTVLGKRKFALKRVTICYRLSTGDKIDRTDIYDTDASGDAPRVYSDDTDRTYSTLEPLQCYTETFSPLLAPAGAFLLILDFLAANGNSYLDVGPVTTTWSPSGVSPVRTGNTAGGLRTP